MKPEPVFAAIEQLQSPGCKRIYLTPDGVPLSPALAAAAAAPTRIGA